jgi:hypothetical protein
VTTMRDDWEDWRTLWRAERENAAQLAVALERTRRARRMRIAVHASRIGLAGIAVVGIVMALRHAGSPLEIALGFTAGGAIIVYTLAQIIVLRRERRVLAAPSDEYVATLSEIRRQQLRFVRFAWGVLFLELVFLIPWWVGGVPVHTHQPSARIVIIGFWLPVTAILGFVIWSTRCRGAVIAEINRLDALRSRLDS